MLKRLSLIGVLLILWTSVAIAGALTDLNSGYGDLSWGIAPPSSGYSYLGTDMEDSFYVKQGAGMIETPLGTPIISDKVHYVFNCDRFYLVSMVLPKPSGDLMCKDLIKAYGFPSIINKGNYKKLYWKLNNALVVHEDYGSSTFVRVFYKPILEEVLQQQAGTSINQIYP